MAKVGTEVEQGRTLSIVGIAGTGDNAVVIQTESIERFTEFTLMSTAGAMDVFPSLDGSNFATAPLSLADLGSVVTDPVLVTIANRIYRFRGIYKAIKVQQNGGGAIANAVLLCGKEK